MIGGAADADIGTADRSEAERLDGADPLASWRDEFVITDPTLVYLDGNSLGMTPRRTMDALEDVVRSQWADGLIRSWWEAEWLALPLIVGDELAHVLGADPGTVIVHESTTIGIFQTINAVLDLDDRPVATKTIAVDAAEFPTDRYVAEGIARLRGCRVRDDLDDLTNVDVVIRSMVDYRTAEVADVAAENDRALASGARIVWDLSHAVGVLDVDLPALDVEFAVGCTYKFLNGGPGAPAFTYVDRRHHAAMQQPIWGWFAQRDQFAMEAAFSPRDGIARLLNGTPGVLGLTAARAGIAVTREAGIDRIERKARTLTGFGLAVADRLGLTSPTPRQPDRRGGHVAIRHPDVARIHRALEERGVIVDRRDPDILRLGMSPLTTRFIDVVDALEAIAELVDEH